MIEYKWYIDSNNYLLGNGFVILAVLRRGAIHRWIRHKIPGLLFQLGGAGVYVIKVGKDYV